jgi:hypothetical protein
VGKFSKETELKIIERYLSGEISSEISKEYGCHYVTILNIIKRYGYKTKSYSESHKQYSVDEDYFDNIDTEDKSYFLGLMYADGCVHSKKPRFLISLQIDDIELLEKFKEKIHFNGVLYTSKPKKKNHKIQKTLSITSKKLKMDLIKNGCFNKKSLILKFPNNKQVPEHLMKHFIRGVFDGDGSIFISNRTINGKKYDENGFSIVGSNCFIDGLYEYFKMKNIHTKSYSTNKNKNKFLDIKSKKDLKDIYNYLYIDSNIYLHRKKEKFEEIINNLNNKKDFYSNENIIQYDKNNNFIKKWDNIKQIEDFYYINNKYIRSTILKCVRGVLKSSNGYIWKCEYEK